MEQNKSSEDEELLKELDTDWDESIIEDLEKVEKDYIAENNVEDPTPEQLDVLLKHFGHNEFRPLQWRIISSIINRKRDNLAVMTTGYGKSLCFQYPPVYMQGIAIVLSPLISLMQDQVLALKIANIPACLLGTANTKKKKTIDEIFENMYRIVYLTPEMCCGEVGKGLLREMVAKLNIVLIAVDEAHCVSSWGHDFRLQYRQLGILRELMPGVPILAVTATATPVVQKDIVKVLKLKNAQISKSGFDRPNFYFAVNYRTDNIKRDFRKYMISENGKWKFSGSTIIYCITRKKTEDMSEKLKALGMDCLPYHAGLSLTVRKDVHEKFVKDKIPVITATIAFGMGIDKPDVRNIFHYGVSSSLEGYFQEAGRAGRDGMPARCVVFWSENDFCIYRSIWEHARYGDRALERKEQSLEVINSYVNSSECRRKFIMVYFEDNPNVFVPKRLDCCDNCTKKNISDEFEEDEYKELDDSGRFNFTDHAKKFLTVVNELQGQYGMVSYVTYLLGQNEKKFSRFQDSPLFGSGKDKSKTWWKELGTMLLNKKYLFQKEFGDFRNYTVDVTREGNKFLQSVHSKLVERPTVPMLGDFELKSNIWLCKDKTINTSQASFSNQATGWMYKAKDKLPAGQSTTPRGAMMNLTQGLTPTQSLSVNPQLYSELVEKREELADMEDCAPYMIASDNALLAMSDAVPENLEQLKGLRLHGFTQAKLRKYGSLFLKVTATYARKFPKKKIMETVNSASMSAETDPIDVLMSHPLSCAKRLTNSAVESYEFFSSRLNIEQIAEKRNISDEFEEDEYKELDDSGRFNFTDHAKKFLSVVNELQGQYGMVSYVTYLLGQNEKKFSRFQDSPLFGSGKDKSKTWWKELGTMLLNKKYLFQKEFGDFRNYTVDVTREGNKFLQSVHSKLLERPTVPMLGDFEIKSNIWLCKDTTINTSQASFSNQATGWMYKAKDKLPAGQSTTPRGAMMNLTQGLTPTQSLSVNPQLYSELVEKREELADIEDCAPYMIASDNALLAMSDAVPENLEQLKGLRLHGFTQAKLRKYGSLFLKVTATYARKFPKKKIMETVNSASMSAETDPIDVLMSQPLSCAKRLTNSAVESYKFFSSGLNIEQIAEKRLLGPATIKTHIYDCMLWGYPIKLDNFVSMNNVRIIVDAIKKGGMDLLSQVKYNCPEHITYDEIKAVVNYVKVREHLKKLGIKYKDFEDFDYDNISTQKPIEVKNVNLEKIASTSDSNSEPEDNTLTQFIGNLKQAHNNIPTQKIVDDNTEIVTIERDSDSETEYKSDEESHHNKLTQFIADLEEAYQDVVKTVVINNHCYTAIKDDSNIPETRSIDQASEGEVLVSNGVGPTQDLTVAEPLEKKRKIDTDTGTADSVTNPSVPVENRSETSLIDYTLLDSP